jgi:DNA-binding protein HU-beta
VTKADIVSIIASRTGLTKQETETVVDGFIESVIEAMILTISALVTVFMN